MKPRTWIEQAAYTTWAGLVSAAVAFILSGCFTSLEEVRSRSYRSWTAEECMALIMENTRHNLRADGQVVYALVMPYTPEVAQAIARYRQLKYDYSDSTTYEWVYELTKQGTGTFLDERGRLWDARGNRFSGRRDSLTVLVNLVNKTWPCDPPKINGIPLMRLSDIPCETPAIDDIGAHIFLRSTEGDTIYPSTVWGRKNNTLTTDEHLLVVFDLRSTERQDSLYIEINAFNYLNNREMLYAILRPE